MVDYSIGNCRHTVRACPNRRPNTIVMSRAASRCGRRACEHVSAGPGRMVQNQPYDCLYDTRRFCCARVICTEVCYLVVARVCVRHSHNRYCDTTLCRVVCRGPRTDIVPMPMRAQASTGPLEIVLSRYQGPLLPPYTYNHPWITRRSSVPGATGCRTRISHMEYASCMAQSPASLTYDDHRLQVSTMASRAMGVVPPSPNVSPP